ncbi:hypothetical protein [Pseudomonas sp. R5(2019)]|uniref:hypothetical protein n=1 Tax=Pseudomonas sp. R5(2019) TaxID=2697566 RepID=UPI0014129E84|nr:hypothetical protein [Pseudomonas sp. R5(2019)]NBA95192.1 hypothetical protein [Pseudomonas sp. R5(2019)]
MHPAIGQLNNGKFYAYLNGYDNEPTYRDTAEALEALLAGEPEPLIAAVVHVPAEQAAHHDCKTFDVTLRFQYPGACRDKPKIRTFVP